MTWTRTLLVLACTVWIGACCGTKETTETTEIETPTPEPVTEAPRPEAPGPGWDIPDTTVPGDVGDHVFAVSPLGSGWDVVAWRAGEIASIAGTAATLTVGDKPVPNTPGSLVVPVAAELNAKPGAVLLCDTGKVVLPCILDKVDGSKVTARSVVDGEVARLELTVGEDVMKLTRGLNQLGVAAYPSAGEMALGQVAVVSPTTVWMITASGTTEEVVRSSVVPVMPGKRHQIGDKAYGVVGDGTLRSLEITSVLDGGLRYGVDFAALPDDAVLAFWEITDNITASTMPLKGFQRGEVELQESGDGPQRGEDGFQQGGTQRGSGRGEAKKVNRPNR